MPRPEAIVTNINRRVDDEAKKIGSVLGQWLAQETISSGSTLNAYLDDFQQFEKEFRDEPDGDAVPTIIAKAHAHHQRLAHWTKDIAEADEGFSEEDLDYLLARQLFSVLMLTSGNLRTQALFAASSQEEYAEYRADSTLVGADACAIVRDRAWWHRAVKELQTIDEEKESLLQTTYVVNDIAHQWAGDFVYRGGATGLGRKATETIAAGHVAEQALLELAVDYIFYMDNRNFSLGRAAGYQAFAGVPFLEPKSITLEPAMIYPFSTKQSLQITPGFAG